MNKRRRGGSLAEIERLIRLGLTGERRPTGVSARKVFGLFGNEMISLAASGFSHSEIAALLAETGLEICPQTVTKYMGQARRRLAAEPHGFDRTSAAVKFGKHSDHDAREERAPSLPPTIAQQVSVRTAPTMIPAPSIRAAEVRSDTAGSDEWGGAPTRRPFEWLVEAVRAQGLHKRYYQMRDGRPGKEGSTVTAFVPWPADIDNGTIASWEEYEAAIRAKR